MMHRPVKRASLLLIGLTASGCVGHDLTAPDPTAPGADSGSAARVASTAEHQDVAGVMILAGADGLENRFTPGGTYHATFDLVSLSVLGSMEGIISFPERLAWTLPRGERCYFCGSLSGPATFDVTRFLGSDVTATLAGQFVGHVQGPQASFAGVATLQGSGDLAGATVRLNVTGDLPPFGFIFTYEGTAVWR